MNIGQFFRSAHTMKTNSTILTSLFTLLFIKTSEGKMNLTFKEITLRNFLSFGNIEQKLKLIEFFS